MGFDGYLVDVQSIRDRDIDFVLRLHWATDDNVKRILDAYTALTPLGGDRIKFDRVIVMTSTWDRYLGTYLSIGDFSGFSYGTGRDVITLDGMIDQSDDGCVCVAEQVEGRWTFRRLNREELMKLYYGE